MVEMVGIRRGRCGFIVGVGGASGEFPGPERLVLVALDPGASPIAHVYTSNISSERMCLPWRVSDWSSMRND